MASDKLTSTQVLLPVLMLSAAIVAFFAFQTSLLVTERTAQTENHAAQEKPLEQVGKLKAQITALAQGTLKLSQEGDKNATSIIEQLKAMGVDIQPPGAPAPGAPNAATAPTGTALPAANKP